MTSDDDTAETRPSDLTVRGGIAGAAGTLVFMFGVVAMEYVKRHADLPMLAEIVLWILDVVVLCGAVGFLFTEATRTWDRFSYFVERVAMSPTWPRVKPVLRFVGVVLFVVIATGILLVVIYEAFVIVQPFVPRVLDIVEAIAEKLGLTRYAFRPSVEGPVLAPLSGWLVVRIVFSALAGVWLLRLISYVLQRQWSASVA